MVMIKHFSNGLELVPLLDCNSEKATYAFLDDMLSKFGAPTEVFTNQGIKFRKDFQYLCENASIDHQTTS
jgi:hypothetical protein